MVDHDAVTLQVDSDPLDAFSQAQWCTTSKSLTLTVQKPIPPGVKVTIQSPVPSRGGALPQSHERDFLPQNSMDESPPEERRQGRHTPQDIALLQQGDILPLDDSEEPLPPILIGHASSSLSTEISEAMRFRDLITQAIMEGKRGDTPLSTHPPGKLSYPQATNTHTEGNRHLGEGLPPTGSRSFSEADVFIVKTLGLYVGLEFEREWVKVVTSSAIARTSDFGAKVTAVRPPQYVKSSDSVLSESYFHEM